MSLILDELKKYIKVVPTTKDLIYKENIIDVHKIDESYAKLVAEGKMDVLPFTYGDQKLYFQNNEEAISEIDKLGVLHDKLTLDERDLHPESLGLNNMVSSEIFNSLWIEGIKSPKKEIKQFLKDKSINVTDTIMKYLHNYGDSLKFIITKPSINENTLFALYVTLSKGINMGEEELDGFPYRRDRVQIKNPDNEGMTPSGIKKSFDTIFKELDRESVLAKSERDPTDHVITAIILHYIFELIHPYYDMNGRMGRLFTMWYAINSEIWIYFASFSESINLHKNELYYPGFTNSKINDFKFDVTYFVQSILFAIVSQKIAGVIIDKINKSIEEKYKTKLTDMQRDILMGIVSKNDDWYKLDDFVLGGKEIDKEQRSNAISKLVEWNILEETSTKPKDYKFNWNKDIKNYLSTTIETILAKPIN